MVSPTLKWERIGNRFYRTIEGYALHWTVKIQESHLAVAPGTGTIAVWDRTEVIHTQASLKPQVQIFSSSGQLRYSIPWQNGRISGAFWTNDEHLVIVSENGIVRHYYDFQGNFVQTRLFLEPTTHKVASVDWTSDGLVSQVGDELLLVSTYPAPVIKRLKFEASSFSAWKSIPKVESAGQTWGILALDSTGSKVTFMDLSSQRTVYEREPQHGKFTGLEVSPDGLSVAILTDSQQVLVYSTDFIQNRNGSVGGSIRGHDLRWVGNDAVCLIVDGSDDDELIVLDLVNSARMSIVQDAPIKVFTEIDGLRIISDGLHDFFARVPDPVADIFKLGSASPGAILVNSVTLLEQNSPRANEVLNIIGKEALPSAVIQCYEAATYEMDPRLQKRLLRAAAFGKASLELFDSSGYLRAMDDLRKANNLRTPEIGMLITVEQMQRLGPDRVLDALTRRGEYGLAVGFAEVSGLPREPVYLSWALSHLQASIEKEDAELAAELNTRLSKCSSVAYSEIAEKAYSEGRPDLALQLIAKESRSSERVRVLMSMTEYRSALEDSVESGNVHLVYYVLMLLRNQLSTPEFYRSFTSSPLAVKCFQDILWADSGTAESRSQAVHEFLYQLDHRTQSAELDLIEANKQTLSELRMKQLKTVQRQYSELKGFSFQARMLSEQIQLLEIQIKLEATYESPFVGKSVSDTLRSLLKLSQVSRAEKLRKQLGISVNDFCWMRVRALVESRNWNALYDLANSAKPPIGYGPFHELSLRAGNLQAARSYAELATDSTPEERVQMFLDVGAPDRALAIAQESRREDLITQLQSLTVSESP